MTIQVRKKGVVNLLDLTGKLTIERTAPDLRSRFKGLIDEGERYFIFNMTEASFLDSAGLAEVVACYKRAREHEGTIKLVVKQGSKPRQIMAVTGLDRVLMLFEDEKEAIASFITDRNQLLD